MAKKIAKIDADNMNSLYAGEFERISGSKLAAGDVKGPERRTGSPASIQGSR